LYAIKEIYYTIQGEGFHSGTPAVFCRFSGCNLWSGLEKDRATAICKFCDTDFWGTDGMEGGKYSVADLVVKLVSIFPSQANRFVVFTGGEPGLQLDQALVDALHAEDVYITVETNGTLELPQGIDWITVSPKANAPLKLVAGNELKLVYPQVENVPADFAGLNFEHYYLQPCDDANHGINTESTIAYCLANPKWKLSVQSHKYVGIR
jgi:7-carboxy-7-deazaguanine synthase